jgi:hypothetical protein
MNEKWRQALPRATGDGATTLSPTLEAQPQGLNETCAAQLSEMFASHRAESKTAAGHRPWFIWTGKSPLKANPIQAGNLHP